MIYFPRPGHETKLGKWILLTTTPVHETRTYPPDTYIIPPMIVQSFIKRPRVGATRPLRIGKYVGRFEESIPETQVDNNFNAIIYKQPCIYDDRSIRSIVRSKYLKCERFWWSDFSTTNSSIPSFFFFFFLRTIIITDVG